MSRVGPALSEDKALAVFSMWQDNFIGLPGRNRYPLTHKAERAINANPNRHGWIEIQRVAEHCADNPGTKVLGIICVAEDINADPRKCKPIDYRGDPKLLRIERGDDGEVWATIVGTERV